MDGGETARAIKRDAGSTAALMQRDLAKMRQPARSHQPPASPKEDQPDEQDNVSFNPYNLPSNGPAPVKAFDPYNMTSSEAAAPKKDFDPYNMTGNGPRDDRDLGGNNCVLL